ncbi:MAG: RluA family pseudouridine synthase [Simkaniaceae bacterium]
MDLLTFENHDVLKGPLRLDVWLQETFLDFSRNYFQNLIEKKAILLNGKEPKKRSLVQKGDVVSVSFFKTENISLLPEPLPLEILFEDEHLIAVNKAVGMVVHPAKGHLQGTLVNALLHHLGSLPDNNLRPGIVHRLDKETSGIILVAKTELMQRKLSELFKKREIKKNYLAIAIGRPSQNRIDLPIGRHKIHRKMMCIREDGKEALTEIEVLGFHNGLSLLKVNLLTGRTHQIRVHLKAVNTPLLGDSLYGVQKYNAIRPLLHASELQFNHPFTKEALSLSAPIPSDLRHWIKILSPKLKIL